MLEGSQIHVECRIHLLGRTAQHHAALLGMSFHYIQPEVLCELFDEADIGRIRACSLQKFLVREVLPFAGRSCALRSHEFRHIRCSCGSSQEHGD